MMNTSSQTSSPAKLYALLLRLRPLERGTLMPFSGELVHGAWLEWIRAAAPDVAAMLHDGNRRRLFTCSSVLFPLPEERVRAAERENVHLPLTPEKTYQVRVTLLLGELFPLFYNTLLHFNMTEFGAKKPPFMLIGKQAFLLEEVIADRDDPGDWTGFTSFAQLAEKAKEQEPGKSETVSLEFASLTSFNWLNMVDKTYGNFFARLPLPQYVFPWLAKRWQALAPPELAGMVQVERIQHYVQADGVVIDDYALRPHRVQYAEHPQRGFVGSCTYLLRGPDEATTKDAPLTVRQQLLMLAQLAFYTGVGYKTTMGMGQVRPL